jgi:hypothetical protein
MNLCISPTAMLTGTTLAAGLVIGHLTAQHTRNSHIPHSTNGGDFKVSSEPGVSHRPSGGTPEAVDREIAFRLRDLVARQRELHRLREADYWHRDTPDAQALEQRRQLEEKKLLDELTTLAGHPSGTLATLEFLPPNRQAVLAPLLAAFDAERHELEATNPGAAWDGEDGGDRFERWQDLGRKIESTLADQLTPDELRGWIARHSAEAETLRSRAIDLTQDQFEAVALAEWQFRRAAENGQPSPEELESLRGRRETALQATLPPELRARYERAADSTFQTETSFVSQHGLSGSIADQLYDIRTQVDALEKTLVEKSADPIQRQSVLTEMADSARAELQKALGEPLFAAYLESPLALWLNRFEPITPEAPIATGP